MWITNSPIADVFVVWASPTLTTARSAASSSERHERAKRAQDRDELSLRASITGEIVMDGVEVPEEALLPNAEGLKGPFDA